MLARARAFGLAALLSSLLVLVWAGSVRAAVYWGMVDETLNSPIGAVGAANLGGAAPTSNYLDGLEAPGSTGTSCGVAVTDSYLFWAGERGIGRVNLDGPAAPLTIVPSLWHPCGITADQTHVYWAEPGNGMIGRAGIDGSGAAPFVTGLGKPCDVAIAGGYLYWAEFFRIGRVKLDGSEIDYSLFPGYGPDRSCGLAVRGDYVYWGAYRAIMRAELGSDEIDQEFIDDTGGVAGITTDAEHLYWVDHELGVPASIGRAGLDGSDPNRSFIPPDPATVLRSPQQVSMLGVAVDARPAPPPLLLPERPVYFGKAKHDTKVGSVVLDVWVPDWGTLAVTAPGLSARVIADSTPHPNRGGALRWRVTLKPLKGRPGKRVRTQLKNKGVAKVTVSAAFSVARTNTVSAVRKLKLRKQVKR